MKKAKRVAAEKAEKEAQEREEAQAEVEFQSAVAEAKDRQGTALYCPVSKRHEISNCGTRPRLAHS